MPEAKAFTFFHQDCEHGGVEMQVQMPIHVIERQTGGTEAGELFANLGAQLLAQTSLGEVAKAGADRIVAELIAFVHEARNFFPRQSRMPAEQREMEADAEPGIFLRQRHRFGAIRFVHHQARGSEHALTMRAEDGFIDRAGTAEVVGVDDQATRNRHALASGFNIFILISLRAFRLRLRLRLRPGRSSGRAIIG